MTVAIVPLRSVLPTGASLGLAVVIFMPASGTLSLPLGSTFAPLLTIFVLSLTVMRGAKQLRRPPLILLIVTLFSLTIVSTLLAETFSPYQSLIGPATILLYWIVYSCDTTARMAVVWATIGIAIAQTVLGLTETFFGFLPLLGEQITIQPQNAFIPGTMRAHGTLGHPIVYGCVLLAGLALAMRRDIGPAIIRVPIVIFLSVGIVTSGSASPILVACLLVAIWFLSRKTPIGATFAWLSTIGAFLIVASSDITSSVIEQELSPTNMAHRLNSIAAIPNLIFDRPPLKSLLGDGYESTQRLFESGHFFNDGFFVIDNQFVTTLSQAGLVGAIVLAVLLIQFFVKSDRASWPYVLGFLAMGFSFDILNWFAIAMLLFVGIALGMSKESTPSEIRGQRFFARAPHEVEHSQLITRRSAAPAQR